jgi:hypothetical protein
MKLLAIPRTKYQTIYNGKEKEEMYFGRLISSTANTYVGTEWDINTTYSYLDEVTIGVLNTVYTAKVDNPKGHPSTSRDWFKEGDNKHKILDGVFSSKSVFEGVCEVEFEVSKMDYILGRGIENAKEVKVQFFDFNNDLLDTSFNCDTCAEVETLVTMTYNDNFNCFSCCNAEDEIRDSFAIPIPEEFCGNIFKAKIMISKSDDLKPILISSLCVAKSHYFGCVDTGFKISDKIPAQITEFVGIKATGIDYANMTSSMRGDIKIDADYVDKHRRLKKKHGGYINYYLFDELDAVKSGLLLGLSTNTEYSFDGANNVTMSFEAIGQEH